MTSWASIANTYQATARAAPRPRRRRVNTFPIEIPVQAGDVVGINDGEARTVHDACAFVTHASAEVEVGLLGDALDGSALDFPPSDSLAEVRVNVAANLQPAAAIPPPLVTSTVPPPPTPQCLVPRLGAKKLAAAKKALKRADCRLGRVTKLKGATTKSGLVVSQNPQTGSSSPGPTWR